MRMRMLTNQILYLKIPLVEEAGVLMRQPVAFGGANSVRGEALHCRAYDWRGGFLQIVEVGFDEREHADPHESEHKLYHLGNTAIWVDWMILSEPR